MANFTPNVNLEKPLGSEHYLVPKFNANMDKIDTKFGEVAPKESPELTGVPTAPTAPVNSDNTQIATTAFVKDQIANDVPVLLVSLKNWIINGMFDVWQRGVSQTTSGYGSDDRWNNLHNGSTKTHSRQAFAIGQTEVPNNPTYFSRTVVTSEVASNSFTFKQTRIEDVAKLSGKTIAISFWAKADTNKNLSIELTQQFGYGGSSDVIGIGVQKFALTTSWQRFTKIVTLPSISGKTIGSNNRIELNIWFDAGSTFNSRTSSLGNQNGTFDIANISLVEGSVAVECQNQAYADVLKECQRYLRRFGGETLYQHIALGISLTAEIASYYFQFDQPMRATPTVASSNLGVYDVVFGAYLAVTSISIQAYSSTQTAYIYANVASGLTVYRPCGLSINNSLNGYIEFNAEL